MTYSWFHEAVPPVYTILKWTHYLSIHENTDSCRNRLKKHRIYQILCLIKELCVLLCICLGIFSILQRRELGRENSRIEKFKNAENVKDYLKDTLQYLPLYINIINIVFIFKTNLPIKHCIVIEFNNYIM